MSVFQRQITKFLTHVEIEPTSSNRNPIHRPSESSLLTAVENGVPFTDCGRAANLSVSDYPRYSTLSLSRMPGSSASLGSGGIAR